MKNREKLPEDDKQKLSFNARRLSMSLLAMLFVIYAFIVLSIAWFSSNSSVIADGTGINVQGLTSKAFTLYKWQTDSVVWNEVPDIDLQSAVPNETARYMVICETSFSNINLNLTSFTLPDSTKSDELYDYIYIIKQSESTDTVIVDNFKLDKPLLGFNDTYEKDKINGLKSVNNTGLTNYKYTITGDNVKMLIFDIYISKEVCNYFELWGLSGTLDIE